VVAGPVCYLDASALVKLIVSERETPALLTYLADLPKRLTSVVSAVEVPRAAARRGLAAADQLAYLGDAVDLFDLDAGILEAAASVQPVGLRTLDAIHLATALSLRDDLAAVVSYDRRLAEAALAAGLPVVSPS
jgi:predicted nucleic acid-binding protein